MRSRDYGWEDLEVNSGFSEMQTFLQCGGGQFNDFVELMGAPEMDALGKKYND